MQWRCLLSSPQHVVFSSLFRQTENILPVVKKTVDCKQRTFFLEAQEATGGESRETSFLLLCVCVTLAMSHGMPVNF
jgi:hypothetical protein